MPHLPFGIHFGLSHQVGLILYISAMVAVVLSVFWRPEIGLYYLVPLLPMQTVRYRMKPFEMGKSIVDIVLLAVIIGLLYRGRFRNIVRNPVALSFAVFALYYFASYLYGSLNVGASPIPSLDDPRFSDWKNYVELPFIALVVAAAIPDKKKMAIVLVLMAVAVLAVCMNFHQEMKYEPTWHFSYEVRFAGVLGYAGENGLGAFAASSAVTVLVFFCFQRSWRVRIGLLVVLGYILYALEYSFSRGGYIAFLVGILFLGLVKERKLLLALVVFLLFWQAIVPNGVKERVLMTYTEDTGLEHSAGVRLQLWDEAMASVAANPVAGKGFETYSYLHPSAHLGGYTDTHNYYVKMLYETGVVGLLFLIWYLGKFFRMGYSLFRHTSDPLLAAVGLGTACWMAANISANFFGDRWDYVQVNGLLWVLLGLCIRGEMMQREGSLDEDDETATVHNNELEAGSA